MIVNEGKKIVHLKKKELWRKTLVAPFDKELPPQERMKISLELSELVTRIVTHVICHTLVDYQELLKNERMSVAHAFLQRTTSMHLCNHKLTAEGIVYLYKGQSFLLHEEYKTLTLTRSVYEHLAMFYFLYEHPKTDKERKEAWKLWQQNNKMFFSYNQAWRYLYNDEEMTQFYRHLSMHCHPVYQGLVEYQNQPLSDQGDDGIPLYFSSGFLAHLCTGSPEGNTEGPGTASSEPLLPS